MGNNHASCLDTVEALKDYPDSAARVSKPLISHCNNAQQHGPEKNCAARIATGGFGFSRPNNVLPGAQAHVSLHDIRPPAPPSG